MGEQKVALSLLLVLCFAVVLVFLPQIGVVKAESTIYVRADGTVEGTDMIRRDGNVYTFLGNVSVEGSDVDGIVVERDNIVIDGANYFLQRTGELQEVEDSAGIELEKRTNVTIQNLHILDFGCGIKLQGCSNSKVTGNRIYINSSRFSGLKLISAQGISITENSFVGEIDSGCGVLIDNFYMNKDLRANLLLRNNFTDLTVAIYNIASSRSIISGNRITNSKLYGMLVDGCEHDELVGNVFENNSVGIHFVDASNNMIHHNNFINNQKDVDDEEPVAAWLDEPSVNSWDNGFEGNYWSNYNGTDTDGDGIGDAPQVLYENNQDNYPLMNPADITTVQIPEFPSWTVLPFLVTVFAVFTAICKRKLTNQQSYLQSISILIAEHC